MFKNITLYRLTAPMSAPVHQTLNDCFEAHAFVQCGATQEKSVGWVPPRGHENGALMESVAGQWILKLMVESKTVPADVVKRKVAEQVAHIEVTTGRKPGKKEKRELTEDARLALVPMAFTKQAATLVWIDPVTNLMAIDSASQSRLDDVLTALVKSVDGLVLQQITTAQAPASAMAQWLTEMEAPEGFTVDRECELKACDESKAVVKYGRHPLDIAEVAQHIAQGKIPTRLALTYNDRVSFVLTEGGALKKIAFLDVVFEMGNLDAADSFDADMTIATSELCNLIPDLITALGGEVSADPKVYNNGEAETPIARLDARLNRDGITATVEDNKGNVLATLGHPIDGELDPMYADAVAIVRTQKKASISLVQRYLKIGYNRAARLLETMEKEGVVSRMGKDGSRTIIN